MNLTNSKLEIHRELHQLRMIAGEKTEYNLCLQVIPNVGQTLDDVLIAWETVLHENIAFATLNKVELLKKLEILSNSTAHYRERTYGYSTRGITDTLKQKIMDKMSNSVTHEMRERAERIAKFVW